MSINVSNIVIEVEHHSLNLLEKKVEGSIPPKIPSSVNITNSSIRRSMSWVDMTSQKTEFPLKRVQSSEKLYLEDECKTQTEVNEKKVGSGAAFDDIWSSILSQKKPDEATPAPYVHPLVKRASSLSEKSLEICTESLGSETGSDGFSFPLSEPESETESEPEAEPEREISKVSEYVEVVKYNYHVASKKRSSNEVVRSFPPPLPSLANRDDGSNLQMRTRRQDGRLVVEAVAVPSRNCFQARREDGRLLLTLTKDVQEQEQEEFDDDDVEETVDDDVENVEEELALIVEGNSCLPSATKLINVQIMTKVMELTSTRNMSTWPRGSNRAVITSLDETDDDNIVIPETQAEVKAVKLLNPLPPRPRMSTATPAADMLNAYEYYWRRSDSPTAAAVAVLKPLAGKQNNKSYLNSSSAVSPQVVKDNNNRINKIFLSHNVKGGQQEGVVLVKAAAVGEEYMIPILRGCKETSPNPRRSLYFLEPFCVATT